MHQPVAWKRKAGADSLGSGLNSVAPVWASLWPRIARLSRDLAGKNAGRQEEQQFLGRRADARMFEQIPDYRDAAKQRYLVYSGLLRGHDNASDNHRTAVCDQHFRIGFLRVNCGNALNSRDGVVNLVVGDGYVHIDRAVSGDLRCYVEFEYSVNELHRNRVVHDRLDWNFGTLLHRRLLVVLRNYLRFRDQLADAPFLCRADNEIQSEVRGRESIAQRAGGRRCSQVRDQRHRSARRRSATCTGYD